MPRSYTAPGDRGAAGGNHHGMPPIFRAPMRARDRDLPAGAGADHGVRHGLVGTGSDDTPKGARMLDRFAALPEGTFVWTRTSDGFYRLGRITGPWRRDDSAAARRTGIHNVRAANWLDRPIGEDEVPAAVAETFARGGRNLQRIHGVRAEEATLALWNEA
jgi:hypothetical protein